MKFSQNTRKGLQNGKDIKEIMNLLNEDSENTNSWVKYWKNFNTQQRNRITKEKQKWNKTRNEKLKMSTKISEVSFTNRLQNTEERTSDLEDKVEDNS